VKGSPARAEDGKPTTRDYDVFLISREIYGIHAEEATEELMEFLSDALPAGRITVMYFDEVHELGAHLSTFLRLVQHQLSSTKMWYTFMGTKSKISCYAPHPSEC